MPRIEIRSADQRAEAVFIQAGNYWRAVHNGSPHDEAEVKNLRANVDALLEQIRDERREAYVDRIVKERPSEG